MAVPVMITWVAGTIVTQSQLNSQIRDATGFLLAPPLTQVRQAVAQSIPNGSTTALTFDSEDFDSTGMHSTVTNTTRCTCVIPGTYLAGGGYSSASNATGVRNALLSINGTQLIGSSSSDSAVGAGGSNRLPLRALFLPLSVNDFVELGAFQNSGGALNTAVTTVEQSTLSLLWVST